MTIGLMQVVHKYDEEESVIKQVLAILGCPLQGDLDNFFVSDDADLLLLEVFTEAQSSAEAIEVAHRIAARLNSHPEPSRPSEVAADLSVVIGSAMAARNRQLETFALGSTQSDRYQESQLEEVLYQSSMAIIPNAAIGAANRIEQSTEQMARVISSVQGAQGGASFCMPSIRRVNPSPRLLALSAGSGSAD
jgi:hypothetical protein